MHIKKEKYHIPWKYTENSYDEILKIIKIFTKNDDVDFESKGFECIGRDAFYTRFSFEKMDIYIEIDDYERDSYILFIYDENIIKEELENLENNKKELLNLLQK
jgi:hypothetical protein